MVRDYGASHPISCLLRHALIADPVGFGFWPKQPVSVQGYLDSEPSRSINLQSTPSLALANRRFGGTSKLSKLSRPCWSNSTREPFVDGEMASSCKGSQASLSGDDFRSLRIAVLIALPAQHRAEKKAIGRPTTPPPLCFGLVDAL